MPTLSIVIPTKNEETHLPRLLDGIRGQTFSDYEVIVADAGSDDRTVAIAEEFGARVVPGGLPGVGRNAGAKHATGKWIIFFDADVLLPSERYLEDCLDEAEAQQFDIATCKVKPQTTSHVDRALHEAYNAFAAATERIRPHAGGFCIFVRREIHERAGGFDEGVVFAEDHEYVQRIAKQGDRFGILQSHPIVVSVRRLEKDGRLAIAVKYIYSELRTMAIGSFRGKMPFEYEMGGDSPDCKKESCNHEQPE